MFQSCLYKIDEKPYSCWEMDVRKRNIEFLDNIDPEYFMFQSNLYEKELEGENKHKAALAIRNIYHHAVETLFTLVGATIQAPFCVYAWMYQAQTGDIRNVIRKIRKSDPTLFNNIGLNKLNWETLSNKLFFVDNKESLNIENQIKLAKQFADVWYNLSGQFLEDYPIKEHNAIKHGFRTAYGGHGLYIAPTKAKGQKKWLSLGASEFGSSFYVIKSLNIKPNYQSIKYFLNWSPILLLDVIKLVSISINNFANYLKMYNGSDPSKLPYKVPETDELFNNYWNHVANISQMSFDIDIRPEQIDPFTAEEIHKYFADAKNISK